MFQVSLTNNNKVITYPTLDMHWAVLIPPNLFLGIGPLIVIATTLEFISAQSPQSMKGFLVGVFFAIRGLFQFLNTIIIIPLSLKKPWASREMIEHPPVTNCDSIYLLVTSVTGLIGLICSQWQPRGTSTGEEMRDGSVNMMLKKYMIATYLKQQLMTVPLTVLIRHKYTAKGLVEATIINNSILHGSH